ncbi:hypothetical protein [Nonomuraea cavernae]|uniref:DUF8094 domain-containing protein n=1 Tax=Nonomuraea cavernae TaxID=2045107 RepID=A0A917YYY8_9ACTN|nr:hypothetical protein [Nonomuraea cavernae]MCA2185801.1 hypothetical protein [Nonomuraea cavernae]GGO69565.1 hypothetical protein GCM10012289_31010 [Nonomuraea cavernae]
MRTQGRRKALALAAVLLAGATACSASSPPAPSEAAATTAASGPATPAPQPPAVTRAQAAEAFATFVATDDLLRAGGDLRLALEINRDAEAKLTEAAFKSTGNKPPRYRWGSPTFYVPRFGAGEASPWFTVLVTRDDRPALLTFAKSGDWRLSSATRLLPGQKAPVIALDAEGYAAAVAPGDRSVTISPQYMGPLHATVAETGATGAAGLIASGPYTTDLAEEITVERDRAKADGFSYDSIFSGNDYPVYALRTEGGGALIQYSLSRNTTTTTKTAEDDYIPVPENARWAVDAHVVRRTLRLTETHQYATSVPPSSAPAAARVIAHDGTLTRASGE